MCPRSDDPTERIANKISTVRRNPVGYATHNPLHPTPPRLTHSNQSGPQARGRRDEGRELTIPSSSYFGSVDAHKGPHPLVSQLMFVALVASSHLHTPKGGRVLSRVMPTLTTLVATFTT
jgi:hypothetical protein